MDKGTVICIINDKTFYYGGYNIYGWHLVYTDDENFHIEYSENVFPNKKDCQRIYDNYYQE